MKKIFLKSVGLTVVLVFLLSLAWEFLLADRVLDAFLPDHSAEAPGQKWEFVWTSMVFVLITSVVLSFFSMRTLRKMDLVDPDRVEAEGLTQMLLNNAHDAIVTIDGEGHVLKWNKRAQDLFGWSFEETKGKKINQLIIPEEHRNDPLKGMANFLVTGEGSVVNRPLELKGSRKNGETFPIELTVSATQWMGAYLFTSIIRDISERKKNENRLRLINEKLQRMSVTDALTSVSNRRHFDQFLDTEWRRGARDQRPISLLMIDIDYFKNYNDNYGHLAGDDCLRKVAGVLRQTMRRPTDLVARYGGEEFAVVLPETNEQGALIMGEAIRAGVEGLNIDHLHSKAGSHLTVSMGVATTIPVPKTSHQNFINQADKALYRSKHEGRNRVSVG